MIGFLLALACAGAACSRETPLATTEAPQNSPTAGALVPTQALPDFAALVEQYGKAVVNIEVVGRANVSRLPELSRDDPFFEFSRRVEK